MSMGDGSRVAWAEGMFLRPQHFQQEARYAERQWSQRHIHNTPVGWGASELEIDRGLLDAGKVGLKRVRMIFSDGELVDAPAHDILPEPVEPPRDRLGVRVFLCLPTKRPGDRETARDSQGTRRRTTEVEIGDTVTESLRGEERSTVEISPLVPALMIEKSEGQGIPDQLAVPIGRINEVTTEGAVRLDESFCPTVTRVDQSPALSDFTTQLAGILQGRASMLAGRLGEMGGAPEVSDFLLLQAINRQLTFFRHLVSSAFVHPLDLYRQTIELCADLAVFARPDRMCPEFPAYVHDNQTKSFALPIEEARRCLAFVGDPVATQIPLIERDYGMRVAELHDPQLLSGAEWVLAVSASMGGEDLRRQFPKAAKLGGVEVIHDLVNLQLPGVPLTPLPTAPRQLPYQSGCVYFALERKSPSWEELRRSPAMALHIAGQFPGLELALWVIRDGGRERAS